MRIFTTPSHQRFRIYAAERYNLDDISKAVEAAKSRNPAMVSLQRLYGPSFYLDSLPMQDNDAMEKRTAEIRRKLGQTIAADLDGGGAPVEKNLLATEIAEAVIALRLNSADILKFADILSPIASRIATVKEMLKSPTFKTQIDSLLEHQASVDNVKKLLEDLSSSLEQSKGPRQPAEGQRAGPQTGQPEKSKDKAKGQAPATDTSRRQDFAKIFTAVRDGKAWLPDNATARESENFKEDIGTVAKLCAADAVDKIHRGENIQPQDIEHIANAICEIFSKATRASTGQEHNELAQLVQDGLDLIWGNWREILNRHHGTLDGPMQRLMEGFGRGSGNKVDIRLLKSVMGVVESRMRERIMNAVQQVIGSCPPPLPGPAKAQPKDLCQVYQALYAAMEGDASIMYRTKDINSMLASPGGYLYGPGSISMAENLMQACQPPEEDRRSEQIKIEQMSELILSQIVNWGKVGAGGQFKWDCEGKAGTPSNKPDKNGKIPPNPWANPGVIVFGSVVLLIMSRTVRGVY